MTKEPWWKNIPAAPATAAEAAKLQRNQKGPFIIFAAFALIVVCMVAFLSAGPDPSAPHKGDFQSVAYPSTAEAIVTECGETYTFKPAREHYGYVPNSFFLNEDGTSYTPKRISRHPMIVPAFGYMSEQIPVLDKTFYTENDTELPNREQIFRLMWEGKVIVWYTPDVDDATKAAIRVYANENPNVIALPWKFERDMPYNRKFAFSAWTITKSCALWNHAVATSFQSFAAEHSPERDIRNPPVALYDEKVKELPLIEIAK